jgi:hypothetical protein
MTSAGHFCLNIASSNTPQSLASAFVAGDPNATGPITWLSIQALGGNSALIYVGFNANLLSNANYAFRIEIPVSTIPAAPHIIENQILSLDKVYIYGTSGDDVSVGYIRS